MPNRSVGTLALVTMFAAASPLVAQSGTVTITGFVRDSSGIPIEMAEVSIPGTKLRTSSAFNGQFRLDSVPAGKFWFGVRRLGYAPLVAAVTLRKGSVRQFDVRLDPLPIGLSEVKVQAQSGYSRTGRYSDFARRRRGGWGGFITRDDIVREKPASIAWMLTRYLPGVSPFDIENSWRLQDPTDFRNVGNSPFIGSGRNCPIGVSVNGGMPTGWSVGDFKPDEIEAIEVYRGRTSNFPPEFYGYGSRFCNLVVLWLRDTSVD